MKDDRLSSRKPRRRWPRGLLVVAMGLLVALPGQVGAQEASPNRVAEADSLPTGPDTSVHYVGITSDPTVYVAVIQRGATLVNVYLCDGVDLGVWLQGESTAGSFDVLGADGSTGSGTIAEGTASGSVTLPDGTQLTFTAAQADLPAGLYQREAVENGEFVQARTIVLPDGTAKGKKGTVTCATREKNFYAMMEAHDRFPEDGTYGNIAHDIYVGARNAGCAWAT
jgi:hypothetical protein